MAYFTYMLYLGADHRGFELKEKIKNYLQEKGIVFEDLGAFEYEPDDDYPDFALAVAQKVAEKPESNRGILLCGSGQGVNIAANKVKNIYSFLAWSAEAIKTHEQVNVLSLPADFLSEEEALEIVRIFLETKFPLKGREERDIRRMEKIKEIENF